MCVFVAYSEVSTVAAAVMCSVRCASQTHVGVAPDSKITSSSPSNMVSVSESLPQVRSSSSQMPQVTVASCDSATSTMTRLLTLPPPTPHRGPTSAQSASVTRTHSLRAADRRCGMSNVAKRHSTSSVTTSLSSSASYDGSRHSHRRSALLQPPPAWSSSNSDFHR